VRKQIIAQEAMRRQNSETQLGESCSESFATATKEEKNPELQSGNRLSELLIIFFSRQDNLCRKSEG
jgi:hypothetical protein